jgi:hypothetical protein
MDQPAYKKLQNILFATGLPQTYLGELRGAFFISSRPIPIILHTQERDEEMGYNVSVILFFYNSLSYL